MPEHPGAAPADDWPRGTWLGFDFGLKRIGVAVGQTATRTANPLVVVGHGASGPDWVHIRKILKEWRPAALVVGLPLDLEGNATPMSGRARQFGEALAVEAGKPVAWCDERLTSKAAEGQFQAARAAGAARRRDASMLDAMAAAVILENWLQSLPDAT